jgi:hypothetical protein
MPDRYAPALLLEVLAFWFLLRWLLPAAVLLLLGRVLIGMMAVGTLGTLDQHHYMWAAFFALSATLAWVLLRRWRAPSRQSRSPRFRAPAELAWRGVTPGALAALCEQRIGTRVDAAAPATFPGRPPTRTLIALAGDAVWVIEDESSPTRPRAGRVLARWARRGLVSHVERSRHGQTLELSWPQHGALVRATVPSGQLADGFAGHLVADELSHRPAP